MTLSPVFNKDVISPSINLSHIVKFAWAAPWANMVLALLKRIAFGTTSLTFISYNIHAEATPPLDSLRTKILFLYDLPNNLCCGLEKTPLILSKS